MSTPAYTIRVSSGLFEKTCEYAIHENNRSSMKVNGCWYPEYVKLINSFEHVNNELIPNAARINNNPKKSSAPYFSCNFKCKIKTCTCKYQLTLKENTNDLFLNFKGIRTGNHDHSNNNNKQIRGDERKIIANVVNSEFNGSSKAFCDTMIGRGVKDVPDVQVIRKIVSEQLNENVVSTCWITNLISAADMSKSIIKGRQINGSIQTLEIFPDLTINIHTEKQLKAIDRVLPYNRVVHIDATGSLVKVDTKMRPYGQILNYVMLLKD